MDIGSEPLLRRQRLAKRLLSHHARRQSVCALTGLTRDQVATLRERWALPPDKVHRGPSPTNVSVLFRSPRTSTEAAVLGVLCHLLGVMRIQRRAGHVSAHRPLELGESLCEVVEAYRAFFPSSQVDLERLLLLSTGLSHGGRLSLKRCERCGALILVDVLERLDLLCVQCHRTGAPRDAPGDVSLDRRTSERKDSTQIQARLFP